MRVSARELNDYNTQHANILNKKKENKRRKFRHLKRNNSEKLRVTLYGRKL